MDIDDSFMPGDGCTVVRVNLGTNARSAMIGSVAARTDVGVPGTSTAASARPPGANDSGKSSSIPSVDSYLETTSVIERGSSVSIADPLASMQGRGDSKSSSMASVDPVIRQSPIERGSSVSFADPMKDLKAYAFQIYPVFWIERQLSCNPPMSIISVSSLVSYFPFLSYLGMIK
mmetsp:Transcript_14648/g.18090  ORF Transcript_14648/g.18090 Transcript_14648/m.18090 type:complete len:175 (-) Transcript_14648:827-1351(-)